MSGNSQYNMCRSLGCYDAKGHSGKCADRGKPPGGSTKGKRFSKPGGQQRRELYALQHPSEANQPGGGFRVN